jgi:hypothetical protein
VWVLFHGRENNLFVGEEGLMDLEKGKVIFMDRLESEISVLFEFWMYELESLNILVNGSQTNFEIMEEILFDILEAKPVLIHAFYEEIFVVFESLAG